jgi:hypothetical protein
MGANKYKYIYKCIYKYFVDTFTGGVCILDASQQKTKSSGNSYVPATFETLSGFAKIEIL